MNEYELYQLEAIKKALLEDYTPEEAQELIENESIVLYENCFTLKQVRKSIIQELKARIENFKQSDIYSILEMDINECYILTEIGMIKLY